MQIEEGKFYRTRAGQKVGPMRKTPPKWGYDDEWSWTDMDRDCDAMGDNLWRDDGTCDPHGKPDSVDLIAEWTDTPEPAKAGLPDVMVFIDDASDKMDIEVESGLVQIMARSGGDEAMMLFTPERARAIAAALMAYADQAER